MKLTSAENIPINFQNTEEFSYHMQMEMYWKLVSVLGRI